MWFVRSSCRRYLKVVEKPDGANQEARVLWGERAEKEASKAELLKHAEQVAPYPHCLSSFVLSCVGRRVPRMKSQRLRPRIGSVQIMAKELSEPARKEILGLA